MKREKCTLIGVWHIFRKTIPNRLGFARRDKEAFLSDQCKEIEENNRMGKARHLFKKIRDTKGTFHAKMSSIKDRNGQGVFPTQGWNLGLLHYRQLLYHMSHQGSP